MNEFREMNNLFWLKRELKEFREVKKVERWSKEKIAIILENSLQILLDFDYYSFVRLSVYNFHMIIYDSTIKTVEEIKEVIKQYKGYDKQFIWNLDILYNKIEKIFTYDYTKYRLKLEKNEFIIYILATRNNVTRIEIKFNDVINLKLIYNIDVNEEGLNAALKDINKEKAGKTQKVKEVIEEIFNKEVKIQNKDYVALKKERIFKFIDDIINTVNENNQVAFDEIVEEFLRDLA